MSKKTSLGVVGDSAGNIPLYGLTRTKKVTKAHRPSFMSTDDLLITFAAILGLIFTLITTSMGIILIVMSVQDTGYSSIFLWLIPVLLGCGLTLVGGIGSIAMIYIIKEAKE